MHVCYIYVAYDVHDLNDTALNIFTFNLYFNLISLYSYYRGENLITYYVSISIFVRASCEITVNTENI